MYNTQNFRPIALLCLSLFLGSSYISAQVSGTVFRDFNGNGAKDNNEPLISGITINIYSTAGTICGSAISTGTIEPNYTVSGCGTTAVRVEFIVSTTGSCVNSAIDYTALSGSTYGSSVQFVNGNSTNVNFAIHMPSDYNTGTANVKAYIPIYISGDPLLSGSASGAKDWFVGYPYNNIGDSQANPPTQKLNGATIGPTWGVAYSKQAQKVFSSALLKRHVGLGKMGSGGIYMLTPTATSFTVTEFYNMDANNHRTRADASAPAYGEGTSYSIDADNATISYLGTNDLLTGKPSGLGVIGTNAQRGLTANPTDPSYDPAAFGQIGMVGLGDIDISDDGKYLFVMNLYSRKVFRLELNDAYNPTTVVNVTSYDIPATTCTNGEYRPWGLKFFRNKLYVGVICSAENAGTNAGLNATVYELNNPTASATFNTTALITVPLNYNKYGDYNPWTNNSSSVTGTTYPQPILSDIEFTDNGDMVLGIMDRAGHQWGENNRKFLKSNTTSVTVSTSGDILIAGLNCSNGAFTLENNGTFTSANGSILSGTNTDNQEGPGGKEFFKENSNSGDPHKETAIGALALLKGQGEVLLSAFGQTSNSGDAGSIKLSTSNGAYISNSVYEIYNRTDFDGVFAKANGLGDIEFSGIESPLEIGNRVWDDTDKNGIQDAGEIGIGSVPIHIYKAGTQVGTTTTAADGTWYFNNSNVTMNGAAGLLPNTAYTIRIAAASIPSGKILATANVGGAGQPDVRDSDASLVSGNAEITYTTGDVGQNNHTLDFGFKESGCTTFDVPQLTIGSTAFGSGSAPLAENVTTNGSFPLSENNIAGFLVDPSSEGIFYTFCTEIAQPLLPLQNPYTHELNNATNGFTTTQALRIAQVIQAAGFNTSTGFGTGNNTNAKMVAMQMAIWNAFYDTDYSVSTGNFQLLTDNNGAKTQANTWLTAAQAITTPSVVVHRLHHNTGQDLLKIGDVPPITVAATAPTCTGVGSPNNAGMTITGFTTGQRYQYTSGTTFGGTATPASITTIPAGGVIASALPNTTAAYTVRVYDVSDDACYTDRTVNIVAVVCCTTPPFTLTQTVPTCTGPTSNNNGKITLTTVTNGTHYGVSTLNAGSYDGAVFASATAISGTPDVKTGISNTGGSYIVRIFNDSNTCYTDQTVTVLPVSCNCPTGNCMPIIVTKN